MSTRRTAAWIALAALLGALAIAPAASASSRTAWRQIAVDALTRWGTSAGGGLPGAFGYASAAEAAGTVYGWTDYRTTSYLAELYARQNPDGGWGLGREYDAFQDGSVNGPETTYAITLADHVGPPLLRGMLAGAVPMAQLQSIAAQLVAMPRVPVSRGLCVAYSTQPADATSGKCVHNVNAAVGSFLLKLIDHRVPVSAAALDLIAGIVTHEMATYQPAVQQWPYLGDTGAPQDLDHAGMSAWAMYSLSYPIGRQAAYRLMTGPAEPVAHMRLASLPGGPGSWGVGPGVPVWCDLGTQWLTEARTYLAAAGRTPEQYAQIAVYAARASEVCR